MPTTPAMGLILPDVGITPGPTWASMLNAALSDIDIHDHSSGRGVKVTPSGLNIDSDLTLNSHNLIAARSYELDNQVSFLPVGELRRVYVKGGDLFYNNNSGQPVQITAGNTIYISGGGGIGGDYGKPGVQALVSYSDLTKTYIFTQNTGITANMAQGPTTIYENMMASNGVTLNAPSGLAASYNMFLLSALPPAANKRILTINSSGQMLADDPCETEVSLRVLGTAVTSLIARLTATDFTRGNDSFIHNRNTGYVPRGTTAEINAAFTAETSARTQVVWDTTQKNLVCYHSNEPGNVGAPSALIPVGAVFMTLNPLTFYDPGFLTCNGQAVSRTDYSALYARLGDVYGAGDGVTTFNIPDFRGRVPIGVGQGPANYLGDSNPLLTLRPDGSALGRENVSLSVDELASHTHSFSTTTTTDGGHTHDYQPYDLIDNSISAGLRNMRTDIPKLPPLNTTTVAGAHSHAVSGTTGTQGLGNGHNNMQPSLTCYFIIKH